MRIDVAPTVRLQRLDSYLARQCPDLSRSRAQALIRDGAVRVNGAVERASYQVRPGDLIEFTVPEAVPLQVAAEVIPLAIVYEDEFLLVVDKPAGMTVHPAPGSRSGTLVNALLAHCTDLSGINGVLRPGIVHRLDKDTSGLLVVAKSDAAHRGLAAQLQARRIHRRYAAVVWGRPKQDEATVEAAIGRHPADRKRMAVVEGGRAALTRFTVVERLPFLSLLDVQLETGRTHQIRVHLQHIGHPVFGDPTYGGRNRTAGIHPGHRRRATELLGLIGRQALHARQLRFEYPATQRQMVLDSRLPPDMALLLDAARA